MLLMIEQEMTVGNTKNKWVCPCLGLKAIYSVFHEFDSSLSYLQDSDEEETVNKEHVKR